MSTAGVTNHSGAPHSGAPHLHMGSRAHRILGILIEEGAIPHAELKSRFPEVQSYWTWMETLRLLKRRGFAQAFKRNEIDDRAWYTAVTPQGIAAYDAAVAHAAECEDAQVRLLRAALGDNEERAA